jgi:hypothetical protein
MSGPTENIRALIEVVSQWDDTGMTKKAREDLSDLRQMAKVLVQEVNWSSQSSGEFIEAVKLLNALAEERR